MKQVLVYKTPNRVCAKESTSCCGNELTGQIWTEISLFLPVLVY